MKRLTLIALFLLTLAVLCAGERNEYYFRFNLKDHSRLSELGEIVSIDNVRGHHVYAYANDNEWEAFQDTGLQAQLLPHPGINPEAKMATNPGQMRSWDSYPTYDAYLSMMYAFANDYPNLCRIVDAGTTVGGRKILFAVVSNNVNVQEAEPRLMYTSTMHGDETVGYVLMLRLIDTLLSGYGADPRLTNLMDNAELWINPNANPDGTYYGGNTTVSGARRYNNNGYDLNRNFPDPNGNQYSSNPRQIETTHMMNLGLEQRFNLVANFHGGAEVVNYPWDHQYNLHVDDAWYQSISRAYATSAQTNSPAGYMTYLNNGITNGAAWYVTTGNRQDWTNYAAGGREVTLEISNTKNPAASTLPSFWTYNYDAMLGYLEQGLNGIHGLITDASGNPLNATITVVNHDDSLTKVRSDANTGAFFRYLSPGSYSLLISCNGYEDLLVEDVIVSSGQATELEVPLGVQPLSLQIPLQAGWNQISCNVLPESGNLNLGDIPNLLQIKSLGKSFNPALADHFNTLDAISAAEGYLVNVSSAGTLVVDGFTAGNEAIALKQGWNLVGYLPHESLAIPTALAGISSYLLEVRHLEDHFSRNEITTMDPGKAYWIQVSQDCLLQYPE
ncbi:MAG: carboxypeptidase regulatory-like domain-containing protein [Candidatus Cloacimonetes bacterium]|nr:carboxypeptidase regulatory-like domain-containing protein [Candidatus Cloacimonadota bacterium]